ncbi:MAG: hypothetical protein IJY88_04745 [Clostridia bacterium]|nr:hypothetical protein [Clostridia bacterium]
MDDKPNPRSREKKNEIKTKNELKAKTDSKEKKGERRQKKKSNTRWAVIAFSLSFAITACLSAASDKVVSALSLIVSACVLIAIIFLGILFDIIGLAVTTADISPFNSMAARRLKAGQKAVWLINNAEKVSSFCNDIVGDIAGVVSGATGAGIALKLFSEMDADIAFLLTLALTSLISAVTVGGKALGKSVAIKHSTKIVTIVAKLLCGFAK